MITVSPEKDRGKIKAVFAENGFDYADDSGVVSAKAGDELLGYCLYRLDGKRMEILKLFPTDDLLLADGILRSTIHVACERFVMDIRYSEDMDAKVFKRLDFIKDESERTLNADKLFGGCHCQKG
ncbi:MAG: hypothetical protein J5766_02025 [Clostridia bacterium]|nr:hypothetical protein [Clostridia bacterium]